LPAWFDQRRTQNIFSVAHFVALRLGLEGPAWAISTACSSSAKVFASAQRAIAAGMCDAAVVGGVDSLCLTTLYGFNSLQLISPDICRPADRGRNGISIGEAGGFALLDPRAESAHALLGYGESSDAFHMSSPEPQGRGAVASMRAALARARLEPRYVDYINLHGTGTVANDQAESRAVCEVFGSATPCSSTKGWTGHALGAAGIVEAALSLLAIEQGLLPCSLNTRDKDPAIEACILLENRAAPVRRVLSNSFGFGGSNCSLLLGAGA
jgi:3-oxoacyl-[acyl-carrier-protein] synthase-1